jgi:hypothetical protein
MDSGSSVSTCPYDGFPCFRHNCCEIKVKGKPADVCPRFVLNPEILKLRIDAV